MERLHPEENVEWQAFEMKSSVGQCGLVSIPQPVFPVVGAVQQVVDGVGLSHAVSPDQWAEWEAILAFVEQ